MSSTAMARSNAKNVSLQLKALWRYRSQQGCNHGVAVLWCCKLLAALELVLLLNNDSGRHCSVRMAGDFLFIYIRQLQDRLFCVREREREKALEPIPTYVTTRLVSLS